jgi:hypothetical protein
MKLCGGFYRAPRAGATVAGAGEKLVIRHPVRLKAQGIRAAA